MRKTNFDRHLDQQMQDPEFASRFKRAGEAWDVALQLTALRLHGGHNDVQSKPKQLRRSSRKK